ncbi:MAG TPA: hypothetical protein VF658_04625 [Pyrinomonadaceae bacterium]|jgi:hypothetical protein
MNRYWFSLKLLITIVIAGCLPIFSSAQEEKKKNTDSRQEILDQLHPKPTEKEAPHGIKLLPGYKHKGATDFEGNATGEIRKKNGLKITYAMGLSWGQEADPKDKDKYLQYSEQVINGRVVRFAFTREKVFIVSVPLDDAPDTAYAANFYTKVQKPEDTTDMVTMALSLIQQK